MVSMHKTTCQKCGGPAIFHSDDGVTYCDNRQCSAMICEYLDYRPPDRRGGIGTNDPFDPRFRETIK